MVFKRGDVIILSGESWPTESDGGDVPLRNTVHVVQKVVHSAGSFLYKGHNWYAYDNPDDTWEAKKLMNEDGTLGWNGDDIELVIASLQDLVKRSHLTQEAFEQMANAMQQHLGKGVKMARLPRDRKGKTPIDIGIVTQDGLTRVRVSMGEDGTPGRKNSDLSYRETEDLITMLTYNLALAKGDIKDS